MGRLYVVGTPIGNLEDLSFRAERLLRAVNVIAAEDTRVTRALLARYGISTRLISYREANHKRATADVVARLREGDVALVTDAGMPAVADPGRRLVADVRAAGYAVESVPGPSAVTTALSLSGLWSDRWLFVGFLPNRQAARQRAFRGWAAREDTIVAYEAPHRLREALTDLAQTLPARRVALARELTKRHEEVLVGTAAELLAGLPADVRGEMVLVVEGGPGSGEAATLNDHTGRSRLSGIAAELGVDRRELYRFVAAQREGGRPRYTG